MKFRFVIFLIMLVLFTILIVQNVNPSYIQVFVWNFQMPLSLLIVIVGVIGIILGFIIAKIIDSKKIKEQNEVDKKNFGSDVSQDNPDIPSK